MINQNRKKRKEEERERGRENTNNIIHEKEQIQKFVILGYIILHFSFRTDFRHFSRGCHWKIDPIIFIFIKKIMNDLKIEHPNTKIDMTKADIPTTIIPENSIKYEKKKKVFNFS